jgi:ketosteroid isomerase-like protein
MPAADTDPIELTRAAVASGGSGDYDAMMSRFGADSVIDLAGVGLGTYAGPRAIRRFFEDWIGSMEKIHFELEQAEHLGGGVVLALISQDGKPTGTRTFMSLRYFAVYLWIDGITTQVSHFRDAGEARAFAERLASEH